MAICKDHGQSLDELNTHRAREIAYNCGMSKLLFTGFHFMDYLSRMLPDRGGQEWAQVGIWRLRREEVFRVIQVPRSHVELCYKVRWQFPDKRDGVESGG